MRTGMWNNPITDAQQAVDQALRVRGSRDFTDRASYERFLQDLVHYRNQTRAVRFAKAATGITPFTDATVSSVPRITRERDLNSVSQGTVYLSVSPESERAFPCESISHVF